MKTFLYSIGTLAEAGIFALIFSVLYIFSDANALEILVIDAMITLLLSISILLKIDEITNRKGE